MSLPDTIELSCSLSLSSSVPVDGVSVSHSFSSASVSCACTDTVLPLFAINAPIGIQSNTADKIRDMITLTDNFFFISCSLLFFLC